MLASQLSVYIGLRVYTPIVLMYFSIFVGSVTTFLHICIDVFLQDVGTICRELPNLQALNLSYNLMVQDVVQLPQLESIRVLVLNNTDVNWTKVKGFLSS